MPVKYIQIVQLHVTTYIYVSTCASIYLSSLSLSAIYCLSVYLIVKYS